jgi:hypothetical protein
MKKLEGTEAQLSISDVFCRREIRAPNTLRFSIVGGLIALFLRGQVSSAQGLNTGFDASYWRKVRAAKGIPSNAAMLPSKAVNPSTAKDSPVTSTATSNTGSVVSMNSAACSEMRTLTAEMRCYFSTTCSSAFGICSPAQRACTSPECFAQAGSERSVGLGEALPINLEAARMMLNSQSPNVDVSNVRGGSQSAWYNKTPTQKQARATEWARWVHETDRRPVVDVGQLISAADALAGNGSQPALPINLEAARMMLNSQSPNVDVSNVRGGSQSAWYNKTPTQKQARATEWARWVHETDRRPVVDVGQLISAADALAGNGSQPALPINLEAARMMLNSQSPNVDVSNVRGGSQSAWYNKTPTQKQARATEWARWVHETDRRPVVDVGQLISAADALAGNGSQPALPINLEAARMMLNSQSPNVDVSNVRGGSQSAWYNKTPTQKQARATEWARWVHETDRRPVVDVGQLISAADALAGNGSQPALPINLEAARMMLNSQSPNVDVSNVRGGSQSAWYNKTPTQKQARATEWARWVHETDRRPVVDVGQLISAADALAGNGSQH